MSKMDIVELRLRRTVALMIDWYITNMLASIPITFFLRKDSQFKPEMFELTSYGFNTALIVCLIAITIGVLYYVFIPLYIWKGQTPGKKICKILVFHPLTVEQMQKIVGLMCRELIKRAKDQLGIDLTIRDSVKKHIVETGMDKKYGARPLRRAVQNQLEDKLAEAILSGEIRRNMKVVAGISKKEIKFTAKTTN